MRAFGLAIALFLTSAAGAQRVEELGPNPITSNAFTGRISAVACSKTNPNLYYAAGADGGVWRTFDAGLSWAPLTDSMPCSAIGALAIDPTNENVVYAGTGEANFANHSRYGLGVYKSIDGGTTWQLLGSPTFAGRCISRIVVDPSNPQRVFASVTPAGGFPALAAAKSHPLRFGPYGVFRSSDGGANWMFLAGGLPAESATDIAIDPSNPQVLYAAIGRIFGSAANGIYKSIDGGNAWTKLAGGLPTANVGRISLAVAPSQSSRLYALVSNQCDAGGGGASVLGAYRTDDFGATWTSVPAGSFQSTYGWYLSTVSVQPTNPDVVIMGGLSLRRSTNGGASWSTITPQHVDMHALAWDAAGRLLCGNDGGLHRSTNLGASWSPLNAGLGLIQFYAGLSLHPSDPQFMLGGTQDNGSSRRGAGANIWTHVLGGDGGWTQIDQQNPLRMFAESQGTGNLYRSTTGGAGFSLANSGIVGSDRNCFLPPYEIDPANPSRMLYGTHRVYESLNGGTTWTPVSGDLSNGAGAIRTLAIAPSNPNTVYAATNDGNVAISMDGGRTFLRVRSGVPGWPRVTREIFVHPQQHLTAYLAVAAFDTDQILRTTNGGASWSPLDGNLPNVPVNTVAADARYSPPTLYAGADDGLYVSMNDGISWSRIGGRMPRAAVIDLQMDMPRSQLIVATQGRGLWRLRLATPAGPATSP